MLCNTVIIIVMLEFDGTKLKKLRKAKGLTQGDLGVVVGKKTEHISNYENDHACPPSDVLLSLMQFFKVSPDGLSCPLGEREKRKAKSKSL